MIIYCFDIKTKELKFYNTIKRRFYYDLKKMGELKAVLRSKSVLLVPESKELEYDLFFSKYKEYLSLFKGKLSQLEKIYGQPTEQTKE